MKNLPKFEKNSSYPISYGGAVYIEKNWKSASNKSSIFIESNEFKECEASSGGAINIGNINGKM